MKRRPVGPYRQASPSPARGPTTSCRGCPQPALGLRAGCVVAPIVVEQTPTLKEIPMWFRSWFDSPKRRPALAIVRAGPREAARRRSETVRLLVEFLEDRNLPSHYTMIDLGTDSIGANDLNASGQVVGESFTGQVDADGNPIQHAFLWSEGNMIDLGTLGGGSSEAVAINDRGQVVGWYWASNYPTRSFLLIPEDADADGAPDRWFRDANGDGDNDLMIDLGTLGGYVYAADVNNAGQVVGRSQIAPTGPEEHAFLWQAGIMTDLGAPGVHSEAHAINDAGQIAGTAGAHIALWQGGVMYDLGEGLAIDISPTGLMTGRHPGLFTGPFVWTPPTPTALPPTLTPS